jgi:Protein of unknown function (DUF3618)
VTTETGTHSVERDPAVIEADIVRQREELARTVDALSAKLDIKARAEHKAADVWDSATTDSGRPRPALVLAAGAAVAAVALLVWWRRHG